MQSLTGKQKRFLRAQANTLSPIFSIGKNGLTNTWIDELELAMNKRELIKVNTQQNAEVGVTEVAAFIEGHSNITVVQKIGRTLILYKPAQDAKYAELSVQLAKMA